MNAQKQQIVTRDDFELIEEQLEVLLDDMQSNIRELTRVRKFIRNKLGWINESK